jgi:hypothetical protein
MVWYRVHHNGKTWAVVCKGGKVVNASPEGKWAVGQTWAKVQAFWEKMGAEIIKLT